MLPVTGYRMQVSPRDLGQVAVAPNYQVTNVYPHDAKAFTQGLLFDHGVLYESTGGKSSLREVKLESGKVIAERRLPSSLFGEGIAQWKGTIFQLTWKNQFAILYDHALMMKGTVKYQGEGWGLASDPEFFYMSDGNSEIKVLSPRTFREVVRLRVAYHGDLVEGINSMTFANEELFANVWPTDKVARINPRTGEVTSFLDFSPLRKNIPAQHVLNGLAYDHQQQRLFVTGKNWPMLYEVKVAQ